MQIIRYFSITLLIFHSCSIIAQESIKLNLKQCRQMALANSKTIKIADESLKKARGEKLAARSAWLPNISASATGLQTNLDIDYELTMPTKNFDMATGDLVPNIAMNPMTGAPILGPDGNPVFNTYAYMPLDLTISGGVMAGVSANQPIFAGGKIIAGNKMANLGEDMAIKNKNLKQTEVIHQTDQAYYQYLSVKEKVVLAQKYQALLSQLVDVVNDSYETGMTNKNELLKVKVKYNEAILQVQQAETGLQLARMALCRVIGKALNTPIEIDANIKNVEYDAESLSPVAANSRIEYHLLQNQVEMAKQQVNLVRGDYLPTAGISVSYNYTFIGLEGMGFNNYDDTNLSTIGSIKIPITNFGEGIGKIKSAKADLNMRQLELQQAQELLQLEIEHARLNYANAYTRVEMTRKALEQAEENMRISDDNYSLGMETIVNLLEAQAQWQNAYSNNIDALTEYKVKESNFLRVSNRLGGE